MRHKPVLIPFNSLLLLFCVSFLAVPAPAHAQKVDANRWAILIGVDDYIQAKPLKYCGADMRALRDRLVASGFPEKQVKLLHDDAKEKRFQPFKANIEQQIKLVLSLAGENDMVVFAFSGHGVHLKNSSYLCPIEARLNDPDTLVSLEGIYGQMKDSAASLKLVLVDACRNDPHLGGAKTLTDSTKALARSIERTRLPEGLILLNSCTAGEISWEDPKFGHGVFMHFLLEGLDGKADGDKSGQVTLSELSRYAGLKTKVYVADRFNDSQRPFLRGDLTLDALEFSFGRIGGRPTIPVVTPVPAGPKPGKTFTNSIGMKLVKIPAGEFLMGSPKDESNRDDDEQQHRVRLSKSFYMGATEVTQGQWQAAVNTTPWKGKDYVKEGSEYAATYVGWDDATEYCRRLSKKDGRKYRLPTEAEWEYACRAGTTTVYSFGDDSSKLKDFAWFDENAYDVDERYAHRVGLKRPNAWGLYDMHGNVDEWCQDSYGADYYGNSAGTDPTGPSSGSSRVLRGGSWVSNPQSCRSANRLRVAPSDRNSVLGFRVVCALD